ncbi:MAG: hypothetical protein L6U99_00910 [Clostridium sp.]|nr:MAG: hypothetical protein L6U99_00910 [Clostridium sp.]
MNFVLLPLIRKKRIFAGKVNISFSNESDANYYYVASSLTEVNVLKIFEFRIRICGNSW